MQVQHETAQELLHDRQFQLRHVTQSRNYDYHKLVLPLNIYRLGHTYIDIAAAGRDDFLQLGTEESLLQMTQKSKRQNESQTAASTGQGQSGIGHGDRDDGKGAAQAFPASLSTPKNRFESISLKYSQELLLDLESQKQRLINKSKTLDPSAQAQGAGGSTPHLAQNKAGAENQNRRGSDIGSQASYKWGEDDNEGHEKNASDAVKMERINQQVQAINAEMKTINVDASTLFQSISNGITHTVAVKQNGKMYSWGIGMCGQLGHSVDAFTEM